MGVRHNFQSAVADGTDATLVRPGDWNANHLVTSFAVGGITSNAVGQQDNFSPRGWNDAEPNQATTLYWNGASSAVISGLAGGFANRLALLVNLGTRLLLLAHQNSSSLAANRLDLAFGFNLGFPVVLTQGDAAILMYDAAASRWRLLSVQHTQTSIWRQNYAAMIPGSGTGPVSLGLAHTSQGGTISHPAIIGGSTYKTGVRKWRGATGTTAGTQSGSRVAYQSLIKNLGFLAQFRWCYDALPSVNGASFVGLLNTTTAPGNANPDTFLNMLGFGHRPADTTLQFLANDGTGAATPVNLGVNFPINTTAAYNALIYAHPSGLGYSYAIWRLDDATITPAVGDSSADVPAGSTALAHHAWICNRAVAEDHQLGIFKLEQFTP
ncbi:MAG: hypothetical protein HZB27_12830 [Meiothermus silvanus]|nr:hypothetical protein [Allomeiothermus silvanus]